MRKQRVFVSGCFDLLHSGHIRFLEEAATYGDVYVGIGSDQTVADLKGRAPINTEAERRYMIEALRHVKACFINSGSGIMDFVEELNRISPHIFIVNEDGNSPAKAALCRELGIKYITLKRSPHANLPARSTTNLRKECRIPYRLDLAGGWLDQPFVSKSAAGPVITISIEPNMEFTERSGMASSSRKRAIELWQTDVPAGNREKSAKMLFAFENPPGTKQFSGSQDAIGIVYPGLNRLDYKGNYWPEKISSVHDETILRWLEEHLFLITLGPRKSSFDVFDGKKITTTLAHNLSDAATYCWRAILDRDIKSFGDYCRKSFEAQVRMFPRMADAAVYSAIKQFSAQAVGWKLSGAGGGGYLVLVAEKELPGAIKIKIRRKGL